MERFMNLALCLLVILLSSYSHCYAEIVVDTVDELVSAVKNTARGGDTTIRIADGTYDLNGSYLRIATEGVSVSSVSGDRSTVILDANQLTTEIFQIVASSVTIENLTLMNAKDHPVHVMGSSSGEVRGVTLHNLHIIDPGQQAIKINASSGFGTAGGIISNSLIELTDSGREFVWKRNGSCYTGGIDGHAATGWTIRDNIISGFWCAGGLSEHGVHFWSGSTDTLVERNQIIDCDRGIGFGLNSSTHYGGIIRNNMIYHPEDHGASDVGIGLESASDVQVYNNTIYMVHSYQNAIEYRFEASTGNIITNNLTNRLISSRQDGEAVVSSNITDAKFDWFTDPDNGDLHLISRLREVVDQGITVEGLSDDIDKEARPCGDGIDIGADEYSSASCTSETRPLVLPQLLLPLLLSDNN